MAVRVPYAYKGEIQIAIRSAVRFEAGSDSASPAFRTAAEQLNKVFTRTYGSDLDISAWPNIPRNPDSWAGGGQVLGNDRIDMRALMAAAKGRGILIDAPTGTATNNVTQVFATTDLPRGTKLLMQNMVGNNVGYNREAEAVIDGFTFMYLLSGYDSIVLRQVPTSYTLRSGADLSAFPIVAVVRRTAAAAQPAPTRPVFDPEEPVPQDTLTRITAGANSPRAFRIATFPAGQAFTYLGSTIRQGSNVLRPLTVNNFTPLRSSVFFEPPIRTLSSRPVVVHTRYSSGGANYNYLITLTPGYLQKHGISSVPTIEPPGTGGSGGERGGGALGPITTSYRAKSLTITGGGAQTVTALDRTDIQDNTSASGVGLPSGWTIRYESSTREVKLFVPAATLNGVYRFNVITGNNAQNWAISTTINRAILQPPAPKRPTPKLSWSSHSTTQNITAQAADIPNLQLDIPVARGFQTRGIEVRGYLTGDVFSTNTQISNTGKFPFPLPQLAARTEPYTMQLNVEAHSQGAASISTVINITLNVPQPEANLVDPDSTRGVVRPEVLAWAGSYNSGDTHRVSISRDQLPYELPRAGVAAATYAVSNPGDPTLTIDSQRRISTERPQLYASGASFVYTATHAGQSITLVIHLTIPAAIPLAWAGHESLGPGEEIEVVKNDDTAVDMFRPTGGRAPYTIFLRRVSPAGAIVYTPSTGKLSFPQGLEAGQSFTAAAVAEDADNNTAVLPFRISRARAGAATGDQTRTNTVSEELAWVGGIKNGSTLTINLRNTNTFRLPAVNRRDVTKTLTEGVRYLWDAENDLVTINPEEVSGVPHRDLTYTVTREGQSLSVTLRLVSGQDFQFRGGHGNQARYTIQGGNDIASINLPRTNYYIGDVSFRIQLDNPQAGNVRLELGNTVNKLVLGDLSDDIIVTYQASNQTSTATIVYTIQANSVLRPTLPPEGGVLKLGISKQLRLSGVNRERVDREGLQTALTWVDPCVENVGELRYTLNTTPTNINLPAVSANSPFLEYNLIPLGATPPAVVSSSGVLATLAAGRGSYRYRLEVGAGRDFISKNILVNVDPVARDASPNYRAECTEGDQPITPVVTTRDSGSIVLHFAGVLQEGNRVARMPGSVIDGYEGLTPGAYYGVNDDGFLSRIPVVNGRLLGVAFLLAISKTQLTLLPTMQGGIRND